ncbi:MAG TPA: alpha/beta hydrolase, partial [Pirellulales bacterium]|nr:alpha/beta hydrolase [Pirellulales bacterium]
QTSSTSAKANESVGEPQVYKHVAGRDLKLFIIKPTGWTATDRRPAMVFFHGGGWVGGRPIQFNEQAEYLATRGMVCIQVEYRLLDRQKTDPPEVCVHDAKSAMRWTRAHAAELGIDPQRIGAAGGSAGGHLAAYVGMVSGHDDPQDDAGVSPKADALVLFNPVFDNGPDDGWGHERVGDRYREFSPAHNISADDPPTIIFVGAQDRLIPTSVVERFQAAMKAAGVRCEAFIFTGQPHGFFNHEPWKTKTLFDTDKFLASIGWLQGPPTVQEPDTSNAPPPAEKKKKRAAGREPAAPKTP